MKDVRPGGEMVRGFYRFPSAPGRLRWGALQSWLAILAAFGPLTAGRLEAAGFALMQQGTAAMAQGNAFVAEANDPSAIFYNPAGLNQLKRPEIYLATIFNAPDREYYPPGGGFSQTNRRIYHAAATYLVWPVHDRVALGVGVFAPFGLGTAWHPEWPGRYLTTLSRLKTYNLNPAVAVKMTPTFSLALGFNALYADAELKRALPLRVGSVALPDGEAAFDGDATGVGFNAGLLYEPWRGIRLGLAYRSKVELKFKGDLNLTLPRPLPATPRIGGNARLDLPPSLTVGVSLSRFSPFTFNFDATWTGWSTYDRLQINLNETILSNGVPTRSIVSLKNWRDAWAFRFGANCRVKKNLTLRAGYIYDLTPVPDETFDPQVPDNNRHIFTLGGDLTIPRFTLGLAYNYIYTESRDKNNLLALNDRPLPPAFQANGTYKSDVHALGLSLSTRF